MFTAYVDETAHDRDDGTFVAGFLGDEAAWKLVAAGWPAAIAPLKALHMSANRRLQNYARQLSQAADLTKEGGLKALVGRVVKSDYKDLIPPQATKEGKIFAAWVLCMTALIVRALEAIPTDERLEIVYEEQSEYACYASVVCSIIGQMPEFASDDGMPKLIGCRPISKKSTQLTQAADYLAYALLQEKNDPTSAKAKITTPILEVHPVTSRAEGLLDRDMARLIVSRTFEEVALLEGSRSQ